MSTTRIDQLNKEIEERKAAIAAEEARLAEAKREADRIEREAREKIEEAKRKQARAEHRAKFMSDAKKIVKALKVQGFNKATIEEHEGAEFPTILPQGVSGNGPIVAFDYIMDRSSSWRSQRNGVKVQVGNTYQEGNKRFPQRKGGDFNYDGIAIAYKELLAMETAKVTRRQHEQVAEKSNEARVKRLQDTFGEKPYESSSYKSIHNVAIYHYNTYGHVGERDYRMVERNDNDLILKVEHISEEEASKLLQFMKDNGMLDKA